MTTRHLQARVAESLLSNGRIATIRSLVDADRPALSALFREVSVENLRFRFFSTNRNAGENYLDHLYAEKPDERIALVAEVQHTVVALGTAEIDRGGSAEIAFLVADNAHGLGMGTLLLEHLAAAARTQGVRRFTAEVLADNHQMLLVLNDAGFDVHRTTSHGITTLEMSTAATARAIEAAEERRHIAETSRV